MRSLGLALLLVVLTSASAWADDFALCAQGDEPKLKLAGCSRLIARDPQLATAYVGRALAQAALGEADKAIDDYSRALVLDPRLTVAHYNRGLTFLSIDQPALAASDFDIAIASDANDATAFNGRAMAYASLGRFDLAEADFARAIEIDPGYVRAYLSRASLSLSLARFDAALVDFDQVLQLNPGDADALLGRTYALQRTMPPKFEAVGSTTPMLQPSQTIQIKLSSKVQKPASMAFAKPKKSNGAKAAGVPPKAAKAAPMVSSDVMDFNWSERICSSDNGDPCLVLSR